MKIEELFAQNFVRHSVDFVLELRREFILRKCQFLQFLRTKTGLRGAFLAVFCTLAGASGAAAQSCAMCYQNAAASGAQGGATLRHAILVLLLPAITLFVGILGLVYRRRNPVR